MILKNEKSFHIRLNMAKPTDRKIWEWLHDKEQNQTISVNAFLIEALRRMMIADAGAGSDYSKAVAVAQEQTAFENTIQEAEMELSEEALAFLEGF